MGAGRERGLTTHVLDTAHGRPAAGMRVDFSAVDPDGRTRLLETFTTNADRPLALLAERRAGLTRLLR